MPFLLGDHGGLPGGMLTPSSSGIGPPPKLQDDGPTLVGRGDEKGMGHG